MCIAKAKYETKDITLVGLMAAVICILGPLSIPIPISPIPISMTNFAVYLAVYVLGWKKGALSYLIYLLIGLAGVPVFSAFTGGAGKLLGPTGGYLIGFIFMALVSGIVIDTWREKRYIHFLGMAAGTVICYLFGSVWLSFQAGITFWEAAGLGVLPYIPGDLVKIIVSMIIGPKIYKRLRNGMLI